MASASNLTAPPYLLLFFFLSLLFLSLSNGAPASGHGKAVRAPAPAPAPTEDCTAYLTDMIDCLDFVEQGSNSTKPTASCCAGLKKVVRENERCLCDALDNNKDYGIKLNMSRAVALPSACGISTPSSCKTSVAPATAPESSGSKGGSAIPSPSPSPSPDNSFAAMLPVSAFATAAGIAFLVFCLIG